MFLILFFTQGILAAPQLSTVTFTAADVGSISFQVESGEFGRQFMIAWWSFGFNFETDIANDPFLTQAIGGLIGGMGFLGTANLEFGGEQNNLVYNPDAGCVALYPALADIPWIQVYIYNRTDLRSLSC
jgi:hypothetical protein